MNVVTEGLRTIVAALDALGIGYAVIGGLAVSERSAPRFTTDVDIAVAVADDVAAEAAGRALQQRGFGVLAALEHDATDRLATIRLQPPGLQDVIVDVIFSSTGIEPEIVAAATSALVAPNLRVPVARAGHLVAMKLLSVREGRAKDQMDLDSLRAVVDDEDVVLAREAVRLITERGYDRGKDLAAALDAWLAS